MNPGYLILKHYLDKCETPEEQFWLCAGWAQQLGAGVALFNMPVTSQFFSMIAENSHPLLAIGALAGSSIALGTASTLVLQSALAAPRAATEALGGKVAFKALSLKAKMGAMLSEALNQMLPGCEKLTTRMKEIHAEVGDKGQSYIVSFTTNKGGRGSITGMNEDEFVEFMQKVVNSRAPITVTTLDDKGAREELWINGEVVKIDPEDASSWTPGKREVMLSDIAALTPEGAAQGGLVRDTFYKADGTELSHEDLRELQKTAPAM